MPTREHVPSLDVLRETARARVEASGLKAVAVEAGMTHQSLRAFLNGAEPYARNRDRLRAWYVRTQAGGEMRRALEAMVAAVPENGRERAARELAAAVERVHRAAGVEPPEWLKEIQRDSGDVR